MATGRFSGGTVLQADIEQLSALAGKLTATSESIDRLTVLDPGEYTVVDALPGCPLTSTCTQAGRAIEGAYLRVADRMREVAEKVRGNAANYRATDDTFAASMRGFDFQHTGRR
jgi:hypothetical protein